MTSCHLCCSNDFCLRSVRFSISNIFFQTPMKEDGILRDHPDMFSKAFLAYLPNILTVNQNFSFLEIVKSEQKFSNRSFPSTRRANESDFFSCFDLKRKLIKDGIFLLISKSYFLKLDRSMEYFKLLIALIYYLKRSLNDL